jgi:hypothetical protein
MQTEHFGNLRLELVPFELPDNRWTPYLAIHRFDTQLDDFVCVMEKQRVGEAVFDTPEEAIDEARRIGNFLVETGKFRES